MEKLCNKLVDIFINKGVVTENEREVYEYCVNTLFQTICYVLLIINVGISIHKCKETMMFIVFFLGIRRFKGGYHAKSEIGCFIMSVSIYLIYLIVCRIINALDVKMAIVLFGVFWLYLCLIPTVDCKNKRLLKEEKKRNKLHAIITICMLSLFCIFMAFRENYSYVRLTCSLYMVESFSVFLGIIVNSKDKMYNEANNYDSTDGIVEDIDK